MQITANRRAKIKQALAKRRPRTPKSEQSELGKVHNQATDQVTLSAQSKGDSPGLTVGGKLLLGAGVAATLVSAIVSSPLSVLLCLGGGVGAIIGSTMEKPSPSQEAHAQNLRRPSPTPGQSQGSPSSSWTSPTANSNGLYLRSDLDVGFKSGHMEWSMTKGPRNTFLFPRRDSTVRIG